MMLLGEVYLHTSLIKKIELYQLLKCVQRCCVLFNVLGFWDYPFESVVMVTGANYFKTFQVYCFIVAIQYMSK